MKTFKKLLKVHPHNSEIHIQDVDDPKRQQLEELFYKTNKLFLIVSQIFLSAPMDLHKPYWNRKPRDVHIIWCLTIYIFFAISVYYEYTRSNVKLPTIQRSLYLCEYLVYLFHLLELICMINLKGGMFWKFQSFIIDFDRDLLNYKLRINYNDLMKFIRYHAGLIIFHLIFAIIISYFYFYKGELISFLRNDIAHILPNIIIHISLMQYYALLFMIHKRSEKLYMLLDNLLNNSSCTNVWNFRYQLQSIRSLYARLEDLTKMVNNHFAFSILLVYFGSFVNISVNIFLLYKYLQVWETSHPAWIIILFVRACMHIGKLFSILYYNQNIQNMKNMATLVLSSFNSEHPAIESTLRHFVFQLMSDTRSNFICGIIALNMNFITSLLVAISTLFIFLVQYDITYEALTKSRHD